jgi:hypothetical protein
MRGVHLVAHVDNTDALFAAGIDQLVVMSANDGEGMRHPRFAQRAYHQSSAIDAPARHGRSRDIFAGHTIDECDELFVRHPLTQTGQRGAVGRTDAAAQRRRIGIGNLDDRIDHVLRITALLPGSGERVRHAGGTGIVRAVRRIAALAAVIVLAGMSV